MLHNTVSHKKYIVFRREFLKLTTVFNYIYEIFKNNTLKTIGLLVTSSNIDYNG